MENINNCLQVLGYPPEVGKEIVSELNKLLNEIDFDSIEQVTREALESMDTSGLIISLKELMILLEGKGIYRPDAPTQLMKHLVNGLNLENEDIFDLIARSNLSIEAKLAEQEFLASCAAITQLGYILLSILGIEAKAASSGEHVFLVINFSPGSLIFADLSIDSIKEINPLIYENQGDNYTLKKDDKAFLSLEAGTADFIATYYAFFHISASNGLNHNIHNNLGLAYDKLERFEDAAKELRQAMNLDPGYVEVHNNIAVMYYKLGRADEAEKEFREAIRLNREYMEAHCNLGNIFISSGRLNEGIVEINEALRINPNHAPSHKALGDIFAIQEKNMEAINEYKVAIRIDPDYASPHNTLGNIYFERGLFEESLREFNEALKIEPSSPEAHYGIGLVHYHQKSYEKASQAFVKAVSISPELMEIVPDKLMLKVRQGVSRLI